MTIHTQIKIACTGLGFALGIICVLTTLAVTA